MRVDFSSDRSVLASWGDRISPEAHRNVLRLFLLLRGHPQIVNLHPGYASLQADFDPLRVSYAAIEETLRAAAGRLDSLEPPPARTVEIPVVYGGDDGPDLEEVARLCGLAPDEVVARHAAAAYLVYFVGFSPGFPYLGGLPPELSVPRLDTPRKHVPAGSVAIGGSQTGIYPMSSPGGWRLIGRTPERLFEPSRAEPALLRMGDHVKFVRIQGDKAPVPSPPSPVPMASNGGQIVIVAPGMLTTVQDLGRPGYAHLGISASGAADALSFRAGNRLVGNQENAPALEMTLLGGSFRFEQEALVALCGGEFDASIPLWQACRISAGDTLRVGGARRGARCYLCVRGGIAAAPVLGSASAHVLTGLGGGPLRRGDRLAIGSSIASDPRPLRAPLPPAPEALRVTPGLQAAWFDLPRFCAAAFQVSEDSNRMGIRLRGPALDRHAGHMLTEGVPLGAIQVPPSGEPIILLVEHQTTGGYPKVAAVVSADFHRLGQLRPRDPVRFECVSLETAAALVREQEEWLCSELT